MCLVIRVPIFALLSAVLFFGCQRPSTELTPDEENAIKTHLLELEAQTDSIVTGEQCYARSELLGDWEPLIVSGGNVFSTKAEFLERICGTWSTTQIGAGFDVQRESVELLSSNSALVVRQGIGMIQFEGEDEHRFHLVGTGIWKKESDSWIRLHYHESYRNLDAE
jgi:hypothetical protein